MQATGLGARADRTARPPCGQTALPAIALIEANTTLRDVVEPDDEPTAIRPPLEIVELAEPEARPADQPAACRGSEPTLSQPRFGQIGKYELRDRLGRGSFGVVYSARDPNLERDIAIKVLRLRHLTNGDIVQRFLQEARATARVSHPGIVTIYDCGLVEATRGPTAFIAMELLSGESLTKRLAHSRRFAPDLAAEIGRQVASALEAAHRVDVLHRDLKPDNIHLVPDPAMPSGERVKILDFGLAKLGAGGHTQVQNVFGTPRYMSPEQCRSCAQVDHRGDIYALGCILFELVTGRPPFEGDVRKVLSAHQNIVPPRVRTIAQDCPPAFDELIAEMLAKDPAARPRNMAAVQQALASTGAIRLATSESRAFPPLRVVPVTRVRKPSTAPPIVAVAAPAEPPPSSEFAAMAIVPFPHPQAEGSAPIAVEPRGDSPPPPAVRATTLGHPTPPGRTTLLDHDGWLRRTLRDYAAGDRHADRPLAELIVLGAIIVLLAVAVAILLA